MSDGNGMKRRRICILTMNNGSDLIGDLVGDQYGDAKWLIFEHPCLLQMQPDNRMFLADLLRNSPVRSGTSVEINMEEVMMISAPAEGLSSAYQAHRSGLIMPSKKPITINQ